MDAAVGMTIGEAASRAGVPPKTIRFYESIGLIAPPQRSANRYRFYDEDAVRRLRFIARARGLGFALKEVAALLALYGDRNRSSHDVKRLALDQIETLDRKLAELAAIRRSLADLAERCHGDDRPECPILDELDSPGA